MVKNSNIPTHALLEVCDIVINEENLKSYKLARNSGVERWNYGPARKLAEGAVKCDVIPGINAWVRQFQRIIRRPLA